MKLECRVCRAKADALLCKVCTDKLEQAIAEFPADLRDLELVAARQAMGPLGLGAPGRVCERDDRHAEWEPPGPRTEDALSEAPWEFAPGAADQIWAMGNTLSTWVRHLVESRGLTALPPKVALTSWLLSNLNAIRFDEAAAEIYDELTGLHAENERWIIGRAGAEEFAGRCDAAQVSFQTDEDGTLVPVAAICGAALYGNSLEPKVQCQACGMNYSMAERREERDKQINDQLARAHQIANALTTAERPLPPALLRKWIERDALAEATDPTPEGPACEVCRHHDCTLIRRPLILEKGRDEDGHRLYRVGDVRDRLAPVRSLRRSA